jgi:hypothetical protein
MKMNLFAILAGAALVLTGCVKTVSDTHTFASTWSKDTLSNRYNRTMDQVYRASVFVVSQNGTLLQEYIPHDNTNDVRSLEGKVNQSRVWVRVMAVDPKTTQVDVQARGSWGGSDTDLAHQLATEISLQLSR